MITNDKGIVELKHHILREVCRLAWEDRLTADSCERLVLEVIPVLSLSTAAVYTRSGRSSADGSAWPWD